MEKEMQISSELDLELELNDKGQLVISGDYEGKMGGVKLSLYTDPAKLIDKLTDLIPGELDDQLLDGLVAKLLAAKSDS